MYAVAVNGSPRKGGNTEVLLKAALAPLEENGWDTELVQVGGKNIRGCLACNKCFEKKDGKCIVDNDVFNPMMEKMLKADAILMGSPTYFAGTSADLKALSERAGYVAYANDHAFAGKIGAAVVAVRRGGATHAYDTINHMYQMSQMIIPGSTYWNMGVGLHKEDVKGDDEALRNMKNLGDMINWLGKTIQPNMDSFPKM